MKTLKLVTITGADDRTNSRDLYKISQQFPFVEWGVLVSRTKTGLDSRYPSLKWLSEFSIYEINKSVHLCGNLAQRMFKNSPEHTFAAVHELFQNFQRIQLNVSPYLSNFEPESFTKITRESSKWGIQTIIQTKSFNHAALQTGLQECCRSCDNEQINEKPWITALHDASGGRGISGTFSSPPAGWLYPGFAGGITPENVVEKVEEVYQLDADFNDFWIDMETGVRTNDVLDLDKVVEVLNSMKRFVNKPHGS